MSNSAKFFKEERLDGTLPCLPFHLIEPSVDDLQEAAVARHDYSAMDDFEEKRRRKEPCIHLKYLSKIHWQREPIFWL